MSADSTVSADLMPLETPPRGHLLRAETSRLLHRRFIRWIVLIGALGYAVILGIASTQYAKSSPEILARARADMQHIADQQNAYRAECVQHMPAGEDADSFCGPPVTPEMLGGPEDFLSKRPFSIEHDLRDAAIGFGVLVAGVCFLIGATWIGAEWSQKTLMALLFWEPRRLKVFGVKLAVLVTAATAVAALVQVVWLGFGYFLASTKGSTATAEGVWDTILALQGRAVLLALLLTLIGFGLANLIRNTGAALGVGFLYFVAEIILLHIRPAWQPWLVTPNVGAFLNPGGLTFWLPTKEPVVDDRGDLVYEHAIHMSNTHGFLVLAVAALVLVLLGGWLFKRRDLT